MQKKTIIFISIIIVAVLGYIFYMKGASSRPSQSVNNPPSFSEDDRKAILEKLSGKSTVKSTTEDRLETLKSIQSSSVNTNLPSEEERLKILKSLNK